MDYCSVVWSECLKYDAIKLERIQMRDEIDTK